jgi:two-component system chemotaxis response regulator CheY
MSETLEKKIIIAEDSDFSRAVLLSRLRKIGFENLTAPESSVEVWEEIAQATLSDNPFDLLITDLNMPDLDGIDLISKIKDDPMSESLKIIVVSADADNSVISICKSLGVLAFFTKPFREDSFSEIVKAALEEKETPEVIPFFES